MSKDFDSLVNTIICGDCLEVMKEWPDGVIDCCVTSPPYWGLRDYGTATWGGGDVECDHAPPDEAGQTNKPTAGQRTHAGRFSGEFCWKCGAKRIDNQLGLEKTPEEYVAKMVEVFREVRRVMKKEGTLWLNLGDSYATSGSGTGQNNAEKSEGATCDSFRAAKYLNQRNPKTAVGVLKPKDLCGIPWRVAFALQADGWWLRQDIIWSKPNPMPESVTDRCTKAHEYIFLLTKSAKYWYDAEAIKEESTDAESYTGRDFRGPKAIIEAGARPNTNPNSLERQGSTKSYPKRNKRSVWTIATAPYSEAHFATFPPKLIEPCILAGCPKQVCKKCGKARVRIVERTRKPTRSGHSQKTQDYNYDTQRHCTEVSTTGWTDCGCGKGFRPGIVLDPFGGVATTALVAYKNLCDYVMIELSPEYAKMGKLRLKKEKDKFGLFENNTCVVPEPIVELKENNIFKEPAL